MSPAAGFFVQACVSFYLRVVGTKQRLFIIEKSSRLPKLFFPLRCHMISVTDNCFRLSKLQETGVLKEV
jgi:hypothetical protein